jgi:hypothetical protein
MARTYVGRVRDGEAHVLVFEVDGVRPLPNRARRPNLAFGWGGPAQASTALAQSLLWDVLGCAPTPLLAAGFTAEILDHLPIPDFELDEIAVRRWLSARGVRALSPEELEFHLGRLDVASPEDTADLMCDLIERCWDEHTLQQ